MCTYVQYVVPHISPEVVVFPMHVSRSQKYAQEQKACCGEVGPLGHSHTCTRLIVHRAHHIEAEPERLFYPPARNL